MLDWSERVKKESGARSNPSLFDLLLPHSHVLYLNPNQSRHRECAGNSIILLSLNVPCSIIALAETNLIDFKKGDAAKLDFEEEYNG